MTNAEFENLVKKLETKAGEKPNLYRFKVLLFTGLGYGYVLFFLGLLLFLLGISVAMFADGEFTFGNIKVLLITGTLSFFIVKALIVKIERPEGYYLQHGEAPELEKKIKQISLQLKTPEIHAIVLNSEFNAAVTQIPKYGLIGKKQNILMIGMPLLTALSREQFTSVLAHELAHISYSDTAMGAKIYRVRRSWGRLMDSLERNEQFGTFLFRRFFQWYYPRFDAYTFVMARQEEYKADRAAARVTTAETVRDTLCTISVAAPYYYNDYYNQLFEDCAKTDSVPKPYTNFREKILEIEKLQAESYLNSELEAESYVTDTHPCLSDRLKAIGMNPAFTKGKDSAVDYFFANSDAILQHFNELWVVFNEEHWKEQIQVYNASKQRYEEIADKTVDDLDGMLEKAGLTQEFAGMEAASLVYRQIIDTFPANDQSAAAYLSLGEIYVQQKTTAEEGVQLIQLAIEADWECKLPGLELLCDYYYSTEQTAAFEAARAELEEWADIVEQADEECDFIHHNDLFIPHDKPESEIIKGVEQITSHPEIIRAYLVRKVITSIPDRKQYLLALKVQMPKGPDQEEFEELLIEKYVNELYALENTSIIILNGKDDLAKNIRKVNGSVIFSVIKTVQAS